jgi:sugar phosphate isomerase/epimerase
LSNIESFRYREAAAMRQDRRDFLWRAGGCAVAGATLALGQPALAIDPIARSGEPKFKFSLAAYSYRDLLTKKELTLSSFIADCAKFGLEGTELTSYYFPNPTTPEYLHQLRRECFLAGLDVSGTAVGNDFCHPDGEKRTQQIEQVKRWVDNSVLLGAPVIRIFSGNVKDGMTKEDAFRLAVAGMEECCEYAGQHGVHLALENHGGLTETVDGMLELVAAVKSPWFGVNMDTGNFHSDDIYGDLAKIAPYAINVQVKVIISPRGGKREPTDYARLAALLRDAGYRGYIALEYEEAGNVRDECAKHLDELRKAFA